MAGQFSHPKLSVSKMHMQLRNTNAQMLWKYWNLGAPDWCRALPDPFSYLENLLSDKTLGIVQLGM